MSVMTCNFYSKVLGNYVDVSVYIPSFPNGVLAVSNEPLESIYDRGQRFATVYLLHGMLDDHTSWLNWTTVIQEAQRHRMALVMPSGQNSWYVNAVKGPAYYDFISRELPLWAEMNFPLRTDRAGRFIAGLSMGGYGALRHALSLPDRYAAVGCFSGGIDIARILSQPGPLNKLVDADSIFGGVDRIPGSDNDLFALARKCRAEAADLPAVYICCGTEDELCYGMSIRYTEELQQLGYKVRRMEMPGTHEWPVWNRGIAEFLDMIA